MHFDPQFYQAGLFISVNKGSNICYIENPVENPAGNSLYLFNFNSRYFVTSSYLPVNKLILLSILQVNTVT